MSAVDPTSSGPADDSTRRDLAADMTRDGFTASIGSMLAGIVDAIDETRGCRSPRRHIVRNRRRNRVRFTHYREASAVGAATFDIVHALGLASGLIETARRRSAPRVGDA